MEILLDKHLKTTLEDLFRNHLEKNIESWELKLSKLQFEIQDRDFNSDIVKAHDLLSSLKEKQGKVELLVQKYTFTPKTVNSMEDVYLNLKKAKKTLRNVSKLQGRFKDESTEYLEKHIKSNSILLFEWMNSYVDVFQNVNVENYNLFFSSLKLLDKQEQRKINLCLVSNRTLALHKSFESFTCRNQAKGPELIAKVIDWINDLNQKEKCWKTLFHWKESFLSLETTVSRYLQFNIPLNILDLFSTWVILKKKNHNFHYLETLTLDSLKKQLNTLDLNEKNQHFEQMSCLNQDLSLELLALMEKQTTT